MYIAYLDEFGHIGPFVGRNEEKYKESPVFGLAGVILPYTAVRGFGTWFFKRKQELLEFEIDRSDKHPATWEKKGASLYTLTNVEKYAQLRAFTNRFLNKIEKCGGRVFYVGMKKTHSPEMHQPNELYTRVLREAIKRIDQFCDEDHAEPQPYMLVLDEHDQRESLITAASQEMYRPDYPKRNLIEPPFQVESHRYQTLQAADWIAGLVGRISATWAEPDQYTDWEPFKRYFESRIHKVSVRSGVRTRPPEHS